MALQQEKGTPEACYPFQSLSVMEMKGSPIYGTLVLTNRVSGFAASESAYQKEIRVPASKWRAVEALFIHSERSQRNSELWDRY